MGGGTSAAGKKCVGSNMDDETNNEGPLLEAMAQGLEEDCRGEALGLR